MGTKVSWDIPLVSLLVSNLLIIILAVVQNWDFGLVFFVYWLQTVIVVFSFCVKILFAKDFFKEVSPPKKDLPKVMNIEEYASYRRQANLPDMSKLGNRVMVAVVLFICYLVFLAFPLFFFSAGLNESFILFIQNNFLAIILASVIFVINHLISLVLFLRKKDGMGKLYKRMILRFFCLFVFIAFAGAAWVVFNPGIIIVVFFMLLKTFADLATHANEHKDL